MVLRFSQTISHLNEGQRSDLSFSVSMVVSVRGSLAEAGS